MNSPWTTPAVIRVDQSRIAAERDSLEQWLDYHPATLNRQCAGLTAAELKTCSVPPSTLSLLGLVRHVGEVEQW